MINNFFLKNVEIQVKTKDIKNGNERNKRLRKILIKHSLNSYSNKYREWIKKKTSRLTGKK